MSSGDRKLDKPTAALGGISRDGDVSALLAQAMNLHRQGHLMEAQSLYERLLRDRPDHPEALNFFGILQQQRGQSTQAEQLIRRAIRAAPNYASAHTNLGNVLIVQKRFEDAIAAYRQAIVLRPDEVEACVNLGALLRGLGRLPEALEVYRWACERRPGDPEIHYRFGALLAELGRVEEARTALEVTLQANSTHQGGLMLMGTLLHRLGRIEEARAVLGNAVFQLGGTENALALLQHWLRLMPDDPVARHRLAAWFGQDKPARASDAYVTDLFDRYADHFDEHLQRLDYRAPELIGARLADALGEGARQLDVLDAGCGTGLCASMLRPYARRLTGVDLSSRMVEKARERGGYDELAVAELTAFLNERPGAYDLIVSADTLVYFGMLETVLAAAAHALRPGGWLAFTAEQIAVEVAPDDGYCLNRSGRYSHTSEYLDRVLAGAGLEARARADATLRQEGNQPVMGHVVLARKPPTGIVD
ncbi:MAG: tetratricopeptide repeat protein [Candidatus Competibacter sp.]|nr:tetratricopeptide repeat protein [Candidatus Competibacter sp.]